MTEAHAHETTSVLSREERQVIFRCLGDDLSERLVNRYQELDPSLLLADPQSSVANMLTPHADYVGTTLARIQQQGKRKPRSRPNGMRALKLLDLVLGPRVISAGLDPDLFHARVGSSPRSPASMACRMR